MTGFNAIKKCVPMKLLYYLKFGKALLNQKIIENSSDKRKIYYLDAPNYGNLGDQAIAYAIREFAAKNCKEYDFVEISYNEFPQYIKFLKESMHTGDLIFLTGGGNMGDRYRMFEATRRVVISTFKKNKIVVFPQTIDYSEGFWGRRSLYKSKKEYSKHHDLVICAREEYSYKVMKDLYVKNKVLLCPDIVLTLEQREYNFKRTEYGVCLRDDIERALSNQDHQKIIQRLLKYSVKYKVLTTAAEIDRVNCANRETLLTTKFKEFSKCRIVITDRLHGMIFAAITATPCIVFRNANKKIEGVYRWIENLPYIKLLDDVSQMDDVLEFMVNGSLECRYPKHDVHNIVKYINS